MVIIDHETVFLGGIDLCFGRYEFKGYPLHEPKQGSTYFIGQDYSNPRIMDFKDVSNWEKCLIDKTKQPRMPWRDIALRAEGPIVNLMRRHFFQFWNFNNIQFAYKDANIAFNRNERSNSAQSSNHSILQQDTIRSNSLRNDSFHVTTEIEYGSNSDKKINPKGAKKAPKKYHVIYFEEQDPDLLLEEDDFQSNQYLLDKPSSKEIFKKGDFVCQGLRSGSLWSIGLASEEPEHSIQNAYIELIKNSEHFIYIENQF